MDELKIEKNIPMPKKHHLRKGRFVSLLRKMKVGDSILFKNKAEANKFVTAADREGVRVARRQVSQNGEFRIWRTDPDGTIDSARKVAHEKFLSNVRETIYKDRKEKKYG